MVDAIPPPIVRRRRTSLKRGAAALILAPAAAIIPLVVVLLLAFNLGLDGGCVTRSMRNQIQELGITALLLVGPTLVLGLPTWILLRSTHRESGLVYALAGFAEALFCAFYFGYSGTRGLRLDQALGFCLLSLIGGGISW